MHRIFLTSDPSLGAKLRAAVDGLTSGEDAEDWPVDDIANLHGSTVIPAEILRRFADTVISIRELEVLWLEYHGLERAQIAAQLSISPSTVTTHWKNVQRKLELDREGVRKWLQTILSTTCGQECRATRLTGYNRHAIIIHV